ncbi:threonine aldolase family protein [Nocardia fusca]|uniref:threonine aldolase family protein n=1 Tax=Nocardia fusca TaxID=941183 RepID=UPI0007C7C36F|nr:beta-eliminating lyase-related protein [Nocardia fusca]
MNPADSPPSAIMHSFASDNVSGIHPEILAAIVEANSGHMGSYGADPHTAQAESLLSEAFGDGSRAYLAFTGTGANVIGLSAMLRPYHAVLCSRDAHILTDECGAPQRFTGASIVGIQAEHGLLSPEILEDACAGITRGEHQSLPAVVSLTNATELGASYRPAQITAIAEWAHRRGLLVHMDGARLANAAAFQNCSLAEISTAAGVDVVSFGGTKNGLLAGDAVVFAGTAAGTELASEILYVRKQATQLASKMRYLSAQFVALLTDELWFRNARDANTAAQNLASRLAGIPGIEIVHPVEANMVFASMPLGLVDHFADGIHGYLWDRATRVVRMVCSFDTTPSDVDRLIGRVLSLSTTALQQPTPVAAKGAGRRPRQRKTPTTNPTTRGKEL